MKIKMLNTTVAVMGFYTLKKYFKGKIYEVRESTGCRLIARNDAEFVADNDKRKACRGW